MKKFVLVLMTALLLLSAQYSYSQEGVWQWSTEVHNYSKVPKYRHPIAYLWIPEKCRKIRAIIVSQHNMEEISILEDEGLRKKMRRLDVAELWICPRYNLAFDFTDGAWETLEETLDKLADLSGYEQIATAPLIGLGHSAAASAPYYMAASKPERILACISTSGQWPYYRDSTFCPDIWGERNVDFIPCLETMGEYESAESWAMRGLKERSAHPLTPLSMLACPGEGHFASSPEKAAFIALFIKKAIQYGHVDPTKTGWLKERWKGDGKPSCSPGSIRKYKGDPAESFWFFDRETAYAAQKYEARFRGLKRQLVGVMQGGKPVPQQNTHMQLHPDFRTDKDGLTLQLKTFFYNTVSDGSPRHKAWSGLDPGCSIGHARGEPYLEIIAAPAVVSSDNTLTLSWNRVASHEEKEVFIDFCIKHPGDREYRPAVQQARITLPIRLSEGKSQEISFEPIPDISTNTKSFPLHAKSDCGLKVGFYVECGPAYIKGERLYFTKIPPLSKRPVKVSVVAWQYGRTGKDSIQTAQPARRVFYLK